MQEKMASLGICIEIAHEIKTLLALLMLPLKALPPRLVSELSRLPRGIHEIVKSRERLTCLSRP